MAVCVRWDGQVTLSKRATAANEDGTGLLLLLLLLVSQNSKPKRKLASTEEAFLFFPVLSLFSRQGLPLCSMYALLPLGVITHTGLKPCGRHSADIHCLAAAAGPLLLTLS